MDQSLGDNSSSLTLFLSPKHSLQRHVIRTPPHPAPFLAQTEKGI